MVTELCPCGSKAAFASCCEPFLKEQSKPETAEQLMRSRYTAYVRQQILYLKDTLWPAKQALSMRLVWHSGQHKTDGSA